MSLTQADEGGHLKGNGSRRMGASPRDNEGADVH